MKKSRWGIVGTGYISARFADGLKYVEGAEIYAVASRDKATAQAFTNRFGIPKAYSSYEEMAKDNDIDIVYIGTPNAAHIDNALLFLEAGRAVLCDKPLASNSAEVKAMVAKAREKGVFFMEGMWTRFFPAVKKALEWLNTGCIGEPRMFTANFGIDSSADRNQWRFQKSMSGGALMDVGIYPLAMAFAAFGGDYASIGGAAIVRNGVDEVNSMTLQYPDGKIAVLNSAISAKLDNKVMISGTEGCVVIGEGYDWWRSNRAELRYTGSDIFACDGGHELFEIPYPSFGFQYEAAAVQSYVQRGMKEAPEMTLDESVKLAEAMEKLRGLWGVVFDADRRR
jgi:predicted dehydrogenase